MHENNQVLARHLRVIADGIEKHPDEWKWNIRTSGTHTVEIEAENPIAKLDAHIDMVRITSPNAPQT